MLAADLYATKKSWDVCPPTSVLSLEMKISRTYILQCAVECSDPFVFRRILWKVWRKNKSERAGQMRPSKGWLFLARALLTSPAYMNRTECKCVPPYGRSHFQIFPWGLWQSLNQSWISTQWHMTPSPPGPDFHVLWCFDNEALTWQSCQDTSKWPSSLDRSV